MKQPILYTLQLIGLAFILCSSSCGGETEGAGEETKAAKPEEYLNITVLLDLSERIDPTLKPEQAQRDLTTIEAVLDVFEENQKQYGYQISEDKLTLTVANQKDNGYSTLEAGNALTIDMTEQNMNAPEFKKRRQAFSAATQKLYAQATQSKHTGADIWSWFRDNVVASIKKSSNENAIYKNKLIILTDGYMDMDKELAKQRQPNTYMARENMDQLRNKDNWQQIFTDKNMRLKLHEGVEYDNLEVLILEVDPKDPTVITNELEIIKHYWSTWISQVKQSNIHQKQDSPQATKNIIQNFLLNS